MDINKKIIFTRKTFGAIFFISGSCIGAGMLGLPIITGIIGFIPSFFVIIFVWLYMMTTALLLLEANLWFKTREINLITLAKHTLGVTGQTLVWFTFIFLFYCLLVAYIVKGGIIIKHGLNLSLNITLSNHITSLLLTIITMLFVIFGTKSADIFNRICMLILIVIFFYLILISVKTIKLSHLHHKDWSGLFFLIPFLLTTFGFHNVIPTLKSYLDHDHKKIEVAIKFGGTIPLFIYILWIGVVICVIPLSGDNSILSSFVNDEIATEALGVAINSTTIGFIANGFSLFAILSSILAQGLSITDFLSDGLNLNQSKFGKQISCLIAFIPPYIITLINPNVFFVALEYAGGFATIILFGLLPALIVWAGRYRCYYKSEYSILGGSKLVLILIVLGSFCIFSLQILKILDLMNFKPYTLSKYLTLN